MKYSGYNAMYVNKKQYFRNFNSINVKMFFRFRQTFLKIPTFFLTIWKGEIRKVCEGHGTLDVR